MKIGVISSYACIYSANNYGALLQYYALQEYLKARGHQAFWIRSILPQSKIYLLLRHLKNYKSIPLLSNYYRCRHQFMDFVNRYLSVSEMVYVGNKDLFPNCPDADFYITGSDQVWGGVLPENYLRFVSDSSKKIAYAVSFGRANLPQEQLDVIAPWVHDFRAVSVREKSGVDICRLMSVEAEHVLDPTFLIDKSLYPILPDGELEDTLFCYMLNVHDPQSVHWLDIVAYAKSLQVRLNVASCQYSECYFEKKYLRFPSPAQWLYNYSRARCIITNTFHGTVFALIYHKPFVVILQDRETAIQNERLYSLLHMFQLEDRILRQGSISKIMRQEIDWNKVDSTILELRNRTDSFFAKVGL